MGVGLLNRKFWNELQLSVDQKQVFDALLFIAKNIINQIHVILNTRGQFMDFAYFTVT